MAKRTGLEIMADILAFCKKPRRKTHVLRNMNLSGKQNQAYLALLEARELIQIHHSPILYITTQKGRKLVDKMEHLNMLLQPACREG